MQGENWILHQGRTIAPFEPVVITEWQQTDRLRS